MVIPILMLTGLALLAMSTTANVASASSQLPAPRQKPTAATRRKTILKKRAETAKNLDIARKKYALKLLNYVNKGGKNPFVIKMYQKAISAQTTGKPDAQTETKIEQLLGYNVDWKPRKKIVPSTFRPAAKKLQAQQIKGETDPLTSILNALTGTKKNQLAKARAQPLRKRAVKPAVKPAVKRAVKPAVKTTAKTAPKALPAESLDIQAAKKLDAQLRQNNLDRSAVKKYQAEMGGLNVDGVPGPLTEARVEKLLGRDVIWPHIESAKKLHKYYKIDKGRNRDVVKGYQADMGELTVDGIVGPKTKHRYKALTGKVW